MDEDRAIAADGRGIGFARYGDPHGATILYFHGFPGSRREAAFADATAQALCVNLVAIDRPGFGASDFRAARRIGDWPGDVERVADHLGVDRFSVVGVSGGGPYALACACHLRARLHAVGVVSGLGERHRAGATRGMLVANRLGLALAARLPAASGVICALLGGVVRHAFGPAMSALAATLRAPDREMLANEGMRDLLRDAVGEAFRRGAAGPAHELRLLASPWDFRLEDIDMPVRLWQGLADPIVPPAMARDMDRRLADARTTWLAHEGHYSLVVNHATAILRELLPPRAAAAR